eukprot:jgi/Chlat1/1481/Chrsp12S02075
MHCALTLYWGSGGSGGGGGGGVGSAGLEVMRRKRGLHVVCSSAEVVASTAAAAAAVVEVSDQAREEVAREDGGGGGAADEQATVVEEDDRNPAKPDNKKRKGEQHNAFAPSLFHQLQRKGQAGTAKQQKDKQKRKKEAFIYGNYHSYYGYRLGKTLEEDPRLRLLQREWFEGKRLLDIGCNEGLITLAVAERFSCMEALGIDIDIGEQAVVGRKLKWLVARWSAGMCLNLVQQRLRASSDGAAPLSIDTYPENVSFRRENYVERDVAGDGGRWDVILCLSVTKWIHLNWGDEGIMKLFNKIHKASSLPYSLSPGGVLILEPQPISSYKSKRNVSETAKENFKLMRIYPDQFPDYLKDEVGFTSVDVITDATPGSTVGFNRTMYKCVK